MSLEYYRKQLVELRAKLQREKDDKKRDNEKYADRVKSASTTTQKAYYRKAKIEAAASHDKDIECLKRKIEDCKENIAREREKAKRK